VVALRFEKTGPGQWDWRRASNYLARFDTKTFKLRSLTPIPSAANVQWSGWLLRDRGYTYVYGVEDFALASPVWNGLTNYKAMFSDPDLVGSLVNTLLWVIGMVTLPVALGLLVAVLTYGHKWGRWLRLPFLLPYAISGVAVGVIWGFVLQPDGALGQALGFFGLSGAHTGWLQADPGNTLMMIVAVTWQAAGVNALLFVVWVMTQGGPGTSSETLALSMYKETFVLNDYGQGAAIALFLSLVTFAASVLYLRYQLGEAREQG